MTLRWLGLIALVGASACYRGYSSPAEPVSYGWSSQQPAQVQGPPGGAMDPEYGYGASGAAPEASGPVEGYADGAEYAGEPEVAEAPVEGVDPGAPAAAPGDGGYVAPVGAAVTDNEIDATLNGYGTWTPDEDYGRVWRPDPTVVGVDFTPYESCGRWVYTEYGWTFACDWSWGWLPFHYGRWGWFDNSYWGWVPDYTWGPAWVEWRDGGSYVGWRPLGPRVRDFRTGDRGPRVRDFRTRRHDSHWRFASRENLGRSRIRPYVYKNIAEGLRSTTPVTRPSVRGSRTVSASAVIRDYRTARRPYQVGRSHPTHRPEPSRPSYYRPDRGPTGAYNRPSYTPPSRPSTTGGYTRPTYTPSRPPSTGDYTRPTYTPSRPSTTGGYTRPTYTPSRPPSTGGYTRPAYTPPTRSPSPTRPSYSPPSRSTGGYTRPSYTPPSRSTGGYTRPSYTPPSSPPSRSSGSYTAPSRSSGSSGSSYSAPSRSSGSSSAPSRSSSSSSSSSSSGSRSGGRHR